MSVHEFEIDLDFELEDSSLEIGVKRKNKVEGRDRRDGDGDGEGKRRKEKRKYMLEVNPHYINPSPSDTLNVIDARWIDLSTGLFIDITAIHPDPSPSSFPPPSSPSSSEEENTQDQHLICKDNHHYLVSQIFPLRESELEGMRVWVPYRYREVLEEEYGVGALVETRFERYVFDLGRGVWVVEGEEGEGEGE